MRKTAVQVSAVLAVTLACSTVAETGRRQLTLFPDSVMNSLGAQAYPDATGAHPTITGTPQAAMVDRVARRIIDASGHQAEWEVKLLDAPEVVNAFALPGGKIAVYSGILPIVQDEDGLAAVLGHEVGHVTAHHGNERMSQAVGVSLAAGAVDLALDNWSELSPESRGTIMGVLGLASQVGVVLPYSRTHEYEADRIGLVYMVRAGFDPQAAPRVWERMAAAFGGGQGPEFLSTHPLPENRAERLRELIPEVVAKERAEGTAAAPSRGRRR